MDFHRKIGMIYDKISIAPYKTIRSAQVAKPTNRRAGAAAILLLASICYDFGCCHAFRIINKLKRYNFLFVTLNFRLLLVYFLIYMLLARLLLIFSVLNRQIFAQNKKSSYIIAMTKLTAKNCA
jgi:hypothetical protein